MDELVARVGGVGEGVEPRLDADLDMGEREVGADEAKRDEDQADHEVRFLAGSDVEHRQEDEEEHERAAEVLLEGDDHQRDRPHDQHRNERAGVGYADRADAVGEHREHLAVLGQVGRQEDDDADLGDLAGLEGESCDGQPDAAAVDLVADDREQRREQQDQADEHDAVFVLGEALKVLHEGEHDHHEHHAEQKPADLFHRQFRGKARDEGDADARQGEGDREDRGVGPWRKFADGEVGHDERGEHAQRDREVIEGDLLSLVERNHGEQKDYRRGRYAQEQQLGVASRHGLAPCRRLVGRRRGG